MATAKKSTTAKKSSDAPKKPRAPKPVEEKSKAEESTFEKKEPVNPVSNTESVKIRKVTVFIPLDPSETSEKQMIHGSVNGKFYRLSRGAAHELDESLAEHIKDRFKSARVLEEFVEANRYKV